MKINDIFLKDINRSIEGVVKADDVHNLNVEIEEYVLTKDAASGLSDLLEAYTNYSHANGVWISGFFGSGKSHLLKMLAHLLGDVDGQDYSREHVVESFKQKTDDAMLKSLLDKASRIPARSVLFNIDQKASLVSKDQRDALLQVFIKVFNDARGYYGNNGPVARFEEDLDHRGQYAAFKEAFERHAGIPWSVGREQAALEKANIDHAYSEVSGAETSGIISTYQANYAVSIEDFAQSVNNWLNKQDPHLRLNFFVDEVGQFIADDVKLMLNLQTIAESLATKCRGRAWIFVTSQEDVEKVVGDRTHQQSNDFSKIQGRFSTRVKLTSQDVSEVISKRLLEKNPTAEQMLFDLHTQQAENFSTIFSFADGSKTYPIYRSDREFIDTYPFVYYQVPLMQEAIDGLSGHNMFEGKNSSVGERSMLAAVQTVAKKVSSDEVGALATFDLMFSGISAAIQGRLQAAVLRAENHLPDPDSERTILANRLLKALFLVKYVKSFKATPRNLTVLMYDHFGQDLTDLNKRVEDALNLLEGQSYVQRKGNAYEYLTDEEQEIEKEIKNTDVDSSEVSRELFHMLVGSVLTSTKFRYEKNKQVFSCGVKLDDVAHGRAADLTLHFITPESAYPEHEIFARSMGANELYINLGHDPRLMADLRLVLKAEKYIKRRHTDGLTASTRSILESKRTVNSERKTEVIARLREAVGHAQLIVNGTTLDVASTDPEARVNEGVQVLVGHAYPQLGLLGGITFAEQQVAQVLSDKDGLIAHKDLETAFASAGYEVDAWISEQHRHSEVVTMKKLTDRFQAMPYGWSQVAVEVIVAWLVASGKVRLHCDGQVLVRSEAADALRASAKHQALWIEQQKTYDQQRVLEFQRFCKEFFDTAAVPPDPTELAQFATRSFADVKRDLEAIERAGRYPFVSQLRKPIKLIESAISQDADWYFETFDAADDLMDAKVDITDPIRAFLNGSQATIYDEARDFLDANSGNIGFVDGTRADEIRDLLKDPSIYRGDSRIRRVKMALEQLQSEVVAAVEDHREKTVNDIESRRSQIKNSEIFQQASSSAQDEVMDKIAHAVSTVSAASDIAMVTHLGRTFEDEIYPHLFDTLAPLAPVESNTSRSSVTPVIVETPTVSVKTLAVPDAPAILQSVDDVDVYVARLRRVLVDTVNEGKRISL